MFTRCSETAEHARRVAHLAASGHMLEVVAGAKNAITASDDNGDKLGRIDGQRIERAMQFEVRRIVHGTKHLGPIDRDDRDRPAALHRMKR